MTGGVKASLTWHETVRVCYLAGGAGDQPVGGRAEARRATPGRSRCTATNPPVDWGEPQGELLADQHAVWSGTWTAVTGIFSSTYVTKHMA